jgi:hypothetical protein
VNYSMIWASAHKNYVDIYEVYIFTPQPLHKTPLKQV